LASYTFEPITAEDSGRVLNLIDADRIPGQPQVTIETLAEATAGRSPVDSGWWTELEGVTTEVATSGDEVVGVVSYAIRPRDGAGLLLWMHGREEPSVVAAMGDHLVRRLAECSVVEAFSFASALGLGLEALPIGHRPVTHQALLARGFIGTDLWRYMRIDLPARNLPRTEYELTSEEDRRTLTVRDGDRLLAEATVGLPVQGVGVLWWIGVEPEVRGTGLGRALLGSALEVAYALGAQEVILYVDDDEPGGDRDRAAANRLYDSVGFVEVDRLWSYRLDRPAKR
jgi:ribosomal protein S18 acetylase RimI-like enzyme